MSHVVNRPILRVDRARHSWKWIAPTTLGLLIASSPWSADNPSRRAYRPLADAIGFAMTDRMLPKAKVASAPHRFRREQNAALDASAAARKRPSSAGHLETDPIARARQVIADCKTRYLTVHDYTCTFFKRERIDGKLYAPAHHDHEGPDQATSLYFKFSSPTPGARRSMSTAITTTRSSPTTWGSAKFLAGTMHLDPKGGMAMEDNRHPVTEAGIGTMIDLVKERWDTELHPGSRCSLSIPRPRWAIGLPDDRVDPSPAQPGLPVSQGQALHR